MNFPENLKYTNDHEWVLIEGNIGTIGITEYAQGELGDIVFIDIDESLDEIQKDGTCGTIDAVKTVSDIFAPFNGKVVEINSTLKDNPEVVNSDPYGKGWMLKAEINNPADLDELIDAATYKDLVGQ